MTLDEVVAAYGSASAGLAAADLKFYQFLRELEARVATVEARAVSLSGSVVTGTFTGTLG